MYNEDHDVHMKLLTDKKKMYSISFQYGTTITNDLTGAPPPQFPTNLFGQNTPRSNITEFWLKLTFFSHILHVVLSGFKCNNSTLLLECLC